MVRIQFWGGGIPNPHWPGVVVLVRVAFMGQIDPLKNHSYSIGPSKKKNFKKHLLKKCQYEHTINAIP